jgi:cell division control protein 6
MSSVNILDDIFEKFVNNKKIFKNREVLRHSFLPNNLPHREEQIQRVGETVAPVLKGVRGSNIFIYGKTGTGKTAVTKYVLTLLENKAKKINSPIKFCYINCRFVGTEYRVFVNLCKSIGLSVPFTGLSIGEIFNRFKTNLDPFKLIFIIILDEIDALIKKSGDNLLYELTRINEELSYSKVSIIGISNDLRLKEFLDPRVLSSLSEEEIVFKPYNADELRNILYERSKSAFYNNVLKEGALGLCAALAAAEHGDARRALDLLRVAGEVAEREGVNLIIEKHIRVAEERIERNRVIDFLNNLTLHSKLVILSIFHLNKMNHDRTITGEIYEVYDKFCNKLGISSLTQRRVSTLINELDSTGLLNAKIISMGRYGRTKKIKLLVSSAIVKKVFANDSRLKNIININ